MKRNSYLSLFGILGLILPALLSSAQVSITEKSLTLPTYELKEADPNPYFFKGRRYQGASGRVYPYPMQDQLTDNKIDKTYKALILENEYIEACILPELGGKLYYAKDKTNGYYFIYYNRVVKPALIGMTGAWTSGGVEWNVPHHHRASSFSWVNYQLEEGKDGSKTVWVGETELRDNMKWAVGMTLYPGKAYIKTRIRIMNTSPTKNSMLFWANASTHTHEDYQVIFPPLTQYATFHKKNQFTEWPISHQIYTGADFRKGVDVSYWKNHVNSTSFFAWETQSNFVAGYDHGKEAGTVIFGSPHTNPGAKLWSWGNNEYGRLWNRFLTDEDGDYVELMFGAFSDNQPDYSWLHPYETKISSMYFMPSRSIPSVKKVNQHGFLELHLADGQARIGVYATERHEAAQVILQKGTELIHSEKIALSPENPYLSMIPLAQASDADYQLSFVSEQGETLIRYQLQPKPQAPMPNTVKAPPAPDQVSSADSLFYVGMRLEQFHEPQLDPLAYYQRALQLDPQHMKSHLRLGINYLRRDRLLDAEKHLSEVVERVNFDYTTAEDAEALYYLGLAQFQKGNHEDAYKRLYRASWDHEWSSAAHYQMALIQLQSQNYEKALFHLDESLVTNQRNLEALSAKASVLRKLNQPQAALRVIAQVQALHPLDLRATLAQQMIAGAARSAPASSSLTAAGLHSYLDVVNQYGREAFYAEALSVLELCIQSPEASLHSSPLLYYLAAYYQDKLGKSAKSQAMLRKAVTLPEAYCFPYRSETQKALLWSLAQQATPQTYLYLGNLYYDKQPNTAFRYWKKAENAPLAMVNRNLAFAYAYHKKDYAAAVKQIKLAIEKNHEDPLFYTEQDKYLRLSNADADTRMASTGSLSLMRQSNHSANTYLKLLVLNDQYTDALDLMRDYHFRTWEGDGKRAYEYWLHTHLVLASRAMSKKQWKQANAHLTEALSQPYNIDVPVHSLDKVVHYYQGLMAQRKGKREAARKHFEQVLPGATQSGEVRFFAGMAYQQLGQQAEANQIFESLEAKGQKLLKEKEEPNFFNPFSTAISEEENRAKATYLLALAAYGKGNTEEAKRLAQTAMQLDNTLEGLTFKLALIQ